MAASNDHQDVLKPFHERAAEAEDRLARLEAAFATKKDAGNEMLKMASELQLKLEGLKADQISERKKVLEEFDKLQAENAKLKYQVTHLVRALKEADMKLASN
ncbi:uncharacterized protein LOC127789524 [Diospyros lotus]|uniref:uncharacterized protein LOC127789524 n=1 Tax=Diospyros lotus TaxID=55363 RepID=UPI00225112F1|nr:uncharacterized protein LOC127789524 [Diospyros lotus]